MSARQLGETFVAQIVGIELNTGGFKKSGGTIQVYCHTCSLLLADQMIEKAQICLEEPSIHLFKEDDYIQFTFSDYKPGKPTPYTFKFVALATSMKPVTKQVTQKEISTFPTNDEVAQQPGYNPIVRGTVNDAALYHAINLHQANPPMKTEGKGKDAKQVVDLNVIINTAKIFQQYFKGELE